MKQVKLASEIVSPSATIGKGGQLAGEVYPSAIVAKVTPSTPSFVLAKRKRDDGVGLFDRKKSKAPMSLRALRQVAGLTSSASCPSTGR